MTVQNNLSRRAALGVAAGAGLLPAALAAPAIARERRVWRMVTSWPKDAPGPGTTARRLAEKITAITEGRLSVEVYGAGELVPAFEVFDAVAADTAQLGHTASFFWAGKVPASPFFTTVPYGLTPEAHNAWIRFGDGQSLWDELYGRFGVKPFLAGNSGYNMAGWYNREITGLEDLAGLRIRIPGLGGEILNRLGATPVSLPPGEIYGALQSGAVDAAEFLGPWSDRSLGLHRVARYYYWPGIMKPNGTAECLVNRSEYEALPDELKAAVEVACQAENDVGLAEANWFNAMSLAELESETEVQLRRLPDEVLRAAREAAEDLLAEMAAEDELASRIHKSYLEMRRRALAWSRVSHHALLGAQIGQT